MAESNRKWSFTALYIEYSLRGIDVETYLILPDYEACQIAIRDNEDMYTYFKADSDVDMYCIENEHTVQINKASIKTRRRIACRRKKKEYGSIWCSIAKPNTPR